jgi:hypothetical protein
MEEAPENGKESTNSAHANGMNEWSELHWLELYWVRSHWMLITLHVYSLQVL